MEKIIELDLNEQEQAAFQHSVDAVKGLVETMTELLKNDYPFQLSCSHSFDLQLIYWSSVTACAKAL